MSSITCSITRALFGGALLLGAAAPVGAQGSPPASPATVLSLPDHLLRRDPLPHRVGRARWGRRRRRLHAAALSLRRARRSRARRLRRPAAPGQPRARHRGESRAEHRGLFDLHQGYLQLAAPWRGSDVGLRAGRQEIALGNERLVGAANWSNTGRTFDGARVLLAPPGPAGADRWSMTAFAAVMEENGRRFGGAARRRRPSPIISCSARTLSRGAPGKPGGDVTLLYDGGARYRSSLDADRTTTRRACPRAASPRLPLELEGALQTGAQSYAARRPPPATGRAFAPGSPARASPTRSGAGRHAGVDLLSGDDTPTDGRYSAFGTMFGTNHPFYGLIDVIGDPAATTKERGLHDAFVTAAHPVTTWLSPRAELHRFTLATGADRRLGLEADLVAPIRLAAGTSLELGYALFRAGSAAESVGLGADRSYRKWVYAQLRAGF